MNNENNNNLNLESLRTTRQILRQSIAAVSGNIAAVILLSFLIFSFRTAIENGTSFVTTFVDKDPSLRSLLSRLDLAARNRHLRRDTSSSSPSSSSSSANLRRRPFLHLTRVGTLDDDFFSGDDVDDRTLLGLSHGLGSNLTVVSISAFGSKLGFSDFVVDNGVRVSEVVRHGVNFRAEDVKPVVEIENSDQSDSDRSEENKNKNNFVDLQFIVKGLELGRKDAAMLFFLVSFLSAAYGWVILGFLVTYSWVLGIVFVSVVNNLLSRFCSFAGLVWDGSRLGLKRLSGFILMRWAVMDAFTQLLGLWYFGEIEDLYSFFKLFVRLKLMPFSVMSPWIRGYEKEVSGFLVAWYFVDFVVGLVFAVDAWIAIVDTRKTGKEIVKEGCGLISGMFIQAVQIKGLECFLCGSLMRWALGRGLLAKLFQSGVEVYFMVVWLMFYFGARCKEANSMGRRFGRREMEGLVDGLR